MTIYRWRAGSRFTGDPEVIVAEFERIRSEHGVLQPEIVIEVAEDEDSPLHDQFPWDDAEAARQHRLDIARRLIRAIVVEDKPGTEERSQYVYTERDYVPLAGITATPGRYMQALTAAQRDLESAERRVNELKNLAKSSKARKSDVATIMLAVEALRTANEAIRTLH